MSEVRKLAAIDIAFLGAKVTVAEYAVGVFGSLTLGAFTALRGHSIGQIVLGAYLVSLGVNYVPLLLYAIAIVRRTYDRGHHGVSAV